MTSDKVRERVLINETPHAIELNRALNEISSERRAHARSYRSARDRQLSVAVYLLLKEALRRDYGLVENPRLLRHANGKPFLPDHPAIHFNFSHCPIAAACIVSDRPVGIDIETISPVDWDVASHVLSATELADVRAAAEPEVSFAEYWTRKEAFVKMTGRGLVDERLPHVLARTSGCRLTTTVNRARGYVLTTAVQEDGIM